MKKIEIEIPEGKELQWVGNTLKLVDVKKPITEHIKTFEDACNELGDEHPFVKEYHLTAAAFYGDPITKDFIAYLKLRIIVAALNEGWEPKFEEDEYKYFPWFYYYTKEEYDKLDDEEKRRCVLRSCDSANSFSDFVVYVVFADASYSGTSYGSRLAFRTRELAEYAGKQFIDIYADYLL